MPLNYKLLEKFGTHEERLKEIFTAAPERLPSDAPEDLKKSVKEDYRVRQKIEELIQNRIDEAILQTLNTSHLYAAVDLAWILRQSLGAQSRLFCTRRSELTWRNASRN